MLGYRRSFASMKRAQAFKDYLSRFGAEKLPIVLSDDNVAYFSNKNKPLSGDLIRQFIKQGDNAEDDELTEYIACCIIPDTKDIHAVVYWKGGLLTYDYIMATYDKNGILLHRKTLAGTRVEDQIVKQSVATIETDWTINIIVGAQIAGDRLYDPQNSRNMSLELMPNGEIIFSLQEETE